MLSQTGEKMVFSGTPFRFWLLGVGSQQPITAAETGNYVKISFFYSLGFSKFNSIDRVSKVGLRHAIGQPGKNLIGAG